MGHLVIFKGLLNALRNTLRDVKRLFWIDAQKNMHGKDILACYSFEIKLHVWLARIKNGTLEAELIYYLIKFKGKKNFFFSTWL